MEKPKEGWNHDGEDSKAMTDKGDSPVTSPNREEGIDVKQAFISVVRDTGTCGKYPSTRVYTYKFNTRG